MIAHYEVTLTQRLFSIASIVAASSLLAALSVRLALEGWWQWWVPLAFASGVAAADFGSGLVHWGADTWGREDLPIIGRRLLVPFRVHHLNPDDFLRRSFIDTNGDVAFVAVPLLAGLLWMPLDTLWKHVAAMFGLGFCAFGMMTNQMHQWAHMPSPPVAVQLLQRARLILGRAAHATHHEQPYNARYCITTGWCNAPLDAVGFFRFLESAVVRVTGAQPREGDRRYEVRYG